MLNLLSKVPLPGLTRTQQRVGTERCRDDEGRLGSLSQQAPALRSRSNADCNKMSAVGLDHRVGSYRAAAIDAQYGAF